MPDDGLAGRDVAPLVFDASPENPAGGRLVYRVGLPPVLFVNREQVGLEHPIDSRESLRRPPGLLRRLDRVHEGDEGVIGRLRLLGVGAQLGQPSAPRVGVLGAVPDVAAEEKLGRELGGEAIQPAMIRVMRSQA